MVVDPAEPPETRILEVARVICAHADLSDDELIGPEARKKAALIG